MSGANVWAKVRRWALTEAPRSPLFPEYSYAAFSAAFGLSLLNPAAAFALSTNYAIMARIAPEESWGWAFLACGLAWAAVVATHQLALRRVFSIMGCLILTWLSLVVMLSNPNSTTGLPFVVVALSSAYSAGRLIIPWTHK